VPIASRCSTPLRPTGATIPNSAKWARMALITEVCWRMKSWRVRWSIRQLCCSGFGLDKPHIGPGHCFADGFGVSGIVLLPLDVGLHIGRRHQAHVMTERLEFARPMMRRSTGLDANQAWRQLLEERQDVAALQLTADEHLAFCVDAVHLKDRLCDIETDGCD